jgi:hypothetical protein
MHLMPRRCDWKRSHSPEFVLTALACLLLTSCGQQRYEAVPLFPAKGSVLFRGEPASGVVVRLHPLAPPDPSTLFPAAKTGADGSFELTTYENNDGAPPGEYAVTIRWEENTAVEGELVDRLKGRYANPKKSPWHIRVEKGLNELQPFHVQ